MYLTGFTYLENEQGSSLIDWMAESVLKIIPLGTYVEEKSMLFTDVEDQETYQMILEKQANDENMVDENGNLIQQTSQ